MLTRRVGSRGFTLIELMVVAAIVGLLASIALPKFADLITKSKEAATKGAYGAIRSALTLYYADNEDLYPDYNFAMGITLGACALDGKYINLDSLIFHEPQPIYGGPPPLKYKSFARGRTGRDIFCNSPFLSNTKMAGFLNLGLYNTAIAGGIGVGHPVYFIYANLLNDTPLMAKFQHPCSVYLDTTGRDWSSW